MSLGGGNRKSRGYKDGDSGDSFNDIDPDAFLKDSSGFDRAGFGGDYGLTGVFGVREEMDELDQRLIAAIEADSKDPIRDLGPLDVDRDIWAEEGDGEADPGGAPRKVPCAGRDRRAQLPAAARAAVLLADMLLFGLDSCWPSSCVW